jgi:hypothetical protein
MARARVPQLVGSFLVALLIVVATVAIVTASFGPTSAAEREIQEERLEQSEELREERRELLEERLEDRR